jgi:hypothetical protein
MTRAPDTAFDEEAFSEKVDYYVRQREAAERQRGRLTLASSSEAPPSAPAIQQATPKPEGKAWSHATFTAEDLRLETFPPLSWFLRDIIPAEGVTLLCSRPKFGKSWLALDACIAATANRFTLGEIKPEQGDVLYLALEDSKRRLQRRITKLLPTFSGKWPEKLTITTKWRRLHEGGLDDIRAWHDGVKQKEGGKPLAVVIDVLAKVRKPTGNKPVYEADYEALSGLCELARELNIAIAVVHHTRKMAADDLMETGSGSYGTTGAVDTVLVMASKGGGAVLDVRGRDVESAELAIQFSKDSCKWTVLGAAAEILLSDQRKAIIAALVEHGEPMKVTELVAATGMKRNPLELLLGKLVRERLIQRISIGIYAHNEYQPPRKPDKPGERVKTRTDQTDGQIGTQATEKSKISESSDLSASPERPDRSDRLGATSVRSVRSVRPPSTSGQMPDRPQTTDLAQQKLDICSSVRSVQQFTSSAAELCAQCGQPGGLCQTAYGDHEVMLHPACRDAWRASYDASRSRPLEFTRSSL